MLLPFLNSPKRNQIISVIIVNLISLSHGTVSGWLSPALTIFNSNETPLLDGPLTTTHVSWLAASLYLGSTFSSPISDVTLKWYGLRGTLISMAIPMIINWLVIAFGNQYWQIVVVRFLAGYTSGTVFKIIPFYVRDIAQTNIRGSLGSMMTLFWNSGILLGYALGELVPYEFVPISIIIPVLYLFLVVLCVPETPQYLLDKGNEIEAMQSLRFYRSVHTEQPTPKEVELEFFELLEHQKYMKEHSGISWKALMKKDAFKSFVLAFSLYLFPFVCGMHGFVQMSSIVFVASGSNLTPNQSALIVMAVIMVGNLSSILLADYLKRKTQLFISSLGGGIFLTLFAKYSYLDKHGSDVKHLDWIPVVSFSVAVFLMSLGVSTIVYVIAAETILPEVKTLALSIIFVVGSPIGSLFIMALPIMVAEIEVYGAMWFHAACCIGGMLIFAVFLAETKGKNLNVAKSQ